MLLRILLAFFLGGCIGGVSVGMWLGSNHWSVGPRSRAAPCPLARECACSAGSDQARGRPGKPNWAQNETLGMRVESFTREVRHDREDGGLLRPPPLRPGTNHSKGGYCNEKGPHKDTACVHRGRTTLILTVYRRDHLAEQLSSAVGQTHRPAEILVLQNEAHVDPLPAITQSRRSGHGIPIRLVRSDVNLKFYGRFMLALGVRNEFVSVWDDDIVPARRFLEMSLKTFVEVGGGLIGANGRNIRECNSEWVRSNRCGLLCHTPCMRGSTPVERN